MTASRNPVSTRNRAAIQFMSITHTEERARMQVSASNTCEKIIPFRNFIFAKGRINEEYFLRNVEEKA